MAAGARVIEAGERGRWKSRVRCWRCCRGRCIEWRLKADVKCMAHAASGPARNFIRLIVGDRVMVALAPKDHTRGRVTTVGEGQR